MAAALQIEAALRRLLVAIENHRRLEFIVMTGHEVETTLANFREQLYQADVELQAAQREYFGNVERA